MKLFTACAFVVGTAVRSGTSFVHAAVVRSADDAAVTPRPLTLEAALGNDASMGSGSGSGRNPFEQPANTDKADAQMMTTMLPPRSREVGQPIAAATTQRRRKNGTSIHRKKMMTMLPPRSREVGQPSAAAMTQRRRKNAKKNKDDDDHKNCSIMSFEGDYVFAKGCDGISYHITISEHRMGYVFEGKPFYDGDSDGGCTYKSEPFTSEDVRITTDDDGHCMLDLIHLHDECDADRDLAVRVVQMNPDLVHLYYSNDNGFTFYNTEAPREAIRSSDRRGLKFTTEDLQDLRNEARRRLQCSDVSECQDFTCHARSNDGGRKCCEKIHLGKDVQCMLNGKGNACKCSEINNRHCYVDLRCNQDGTTNTPFDIWENGSCRVKPNGDCSTNSGATKCTDGYECRKNKCFNGHEFCIEDEDPKYTCKLIEIRECSVDCQTNYVEEGEKARFGRECCLAQGQEEKCILNQNGSTCNCPLNVPGFVVPTSLLDLVAIEDDPCYIDMRCNAYEVFDLEKGKKGKCQRKPEGKCNGKQECATGFKCKNMCKGTGHTCYYCKPS